MKKEETLTLNFKDGTTRMLPSCDYETFEEHIFQEGSSDIEYEMFKLSRKEKSIFDITEESLKGSSLVFEDYEGNRIVFDFIRIEQANKSKRDENR